MLRATKAQIEYISSSQANPDKLMALGMISQLNTVPPVQFYVSLLMKTAVNYVTVETIRGVVAETQSVNMVKWVKRLPPTRNIFECVPTLAWQLVDEAVDESRPRLVIPRLSITTEMANSHNNGQKGYAPL